MPRSCSVISSMPGGAMISTPTLCRDVDLDLALVERALAQLLAQFLARVAVGSSGVRLVGEAERCAARQQRVEDAILGAIFGLRAHLRFACSRASLTAMSARSRTIDSTSLPT